MRNLIRWIALFLLLGMASPVLAREEISLDGGWKFIRQDAPGASEREFDDAAWAAIDLPHSWNSTDAAGGVHEYYRGIGWYRRHFNITAEQSDKAIYVWFGAAGSAADVYVNGQLVGSHQGGYSAFCFDVKSALTPGDNVLAVRVTNAPDQAIAPLGGDFNFSGGLYRNAKLLITESLAISPLDFASLGVYVKQTKVTDDQAELNVNTILRNIEPADFNATVKCTITDAAGAVVATNSAPKVMTINVDPNVNQTLHIDHPHLWNGRGDPYLYNVTVEVSESDHVTDKVTTQIGLRYFKVDPEQGFFLNGKHYDLHGVNRHQDFAGKGWAITEKEMKIDLDLINEVGATFVRLAHYQHSPTFYDLCDKDGMVVWAELDLVNTIADSADFTKVTQQQLTELIKQNFNHPSICFWSIYNELHAGAANWQRYAKFVHEINDLAHQLDSTRLTTAASDQRIDDGLNWITDVIAINKYFGWYSGGAAQWPMQLDTYHAFDPKHAIGMSEYGAGASINQHEMNPKSVVPVSGWHPEEWQNIVHETAYKAMSERPFLWSKLIWNFSDFGSASRLEGDTIGINDKGIVTYDRTVKKDVFYFYKANWSDASTLYITSRRFTPRAMDTSDVKVYSNCDNVELKVNGQSLGKQASADHILIWKDVKMKTGENQLEVSGEKNGAVQKDECTIVVDPTATTRPAMLK